jgi:Tfp pilus assembly protein PilN
MAQQLNLYDQRLRRQRHWGLRHTLAVLGVLLSLCGLTELSLQLALRHSTARLASAEALLNQQRARIQSLQTQQAGTPTAQALELQQLRALDAGQRHLRSLLDSGAAGQRSGHAAYLVALARQSQPAVWLTGFKISAEGDALELQGRLLDAAALPDYLRHLNAEPQFKGRQFAQLQLRRVDASADGQGGGYSEFTLRSLAGGSAP